MALAVYGGGGADYMVDTGAANAYVLTPVSPKDAAPDYFDGMLITFIPGNVNTAASTVNVNSLGVKDLEFFGGVALSGGELQTDSYVSARFNSSGDRFELVSTGQYQTVINENDLINGNFDVWQEDTSQTSSGYGSDDMWLNNNSGSTKTHSQQSFTLGQTSVPGNPTYYSQTVVTSSAGASNYVNKEYRSENVLKFSGTTRVLSFWGQADTNRDIAFEMYQNFGTTGSPSADVDGIGVTQFSLTSAWQQFTTIVSIPSVSGKTLGDDGNDYTGLRFWFDAGTDYDSLTDTLGQQSGTFNLARIKFEPGSIVTPFIDRQPEEELALCQRYFYLFESTNLKGGGGVTGSGNVVNNYINLPVAMRTTPTITTDQTEFAYYDGAWQTASTTQASSARNPALITIGVANVSIGNQTDYLWRWSSGSPAIQAKISARL